MTLTLHGYWRSSASYRVRIALNLKGLEWRHVGVHLVTGGGMHNSAEFSSLNPQKLVPVLDVDGTYLNQSLSILEYLEEQYPYPALLPKEALERAQVRSLCDVIACEMHPLNNLRVLKYLVTEMDASQAGKTEWYSHWVSEGFRAFEVMLENAAHTGDFCHGSGPGMADCCLIPQIYNARRFDIPMNDYPNILRIEENCRDLIPFKDARPENQPDAE
ncbi:MAG: maleylacetoacetate isomerase [Sneathiella sp.]|nr:maleylacetoacetate isomerase [Sneathiella sp.]